MAIFKFDVTQMAKAYFMGKLVIEAATIEDARKIIEDKNVDELEEMVEDWEMISVDEYNSTEVWDTNGELLK